MRGALEILDGLQRRQDWAVLSAERAELSAAENAERTARLDAVLQSFDVSVLPVVGTYGGVREVSRLLFGTNAAEALSIAALFGQESVLLPSGLAYADGSGVIPTDGVYVGTDPRNASVVRAPNGTRLAFVSRIRWNEDKRALVA